MSKIISLILLISFALTILLFAPSFIVSVITNYAVTTNALTSDTEYRGSGRIETKPKSYRGSGRLEDTTKGYRGSGRIDTEPKAYRGSGRLEDTTKGYRGSGRYCILTNKKTKSTNQSNKPTKKSSNVSFELISADNWPVANNIIQLNNSNGDIYKVNKIYNGCKASLTNCKSGSTSTLPLIGKIIQQADAKC